MKSAARLIDTHARRFDVTDTRVVLVDASPAAVHAAGERLELAHAVRQAIEGLGLAGRLVLAPTRLGSREGEHVYGMAARLDGAHDRPGHVKVIWDVRVEPGPESGTTLSMTTRFVSTNRSSRGSLRTAWGVLGPVAAALSKRALAAIKRYAEDRDELPSLASVPELALAA
jgi:hypothetical protein